MPMLEVESDKGLPADHRLRPRIRVLRKSGPLYPYDAEALPGRRFHHDPTRQVTDNRCAQRLEARDFRGNVVALDIDVDATFMVHTLDLHNGFVWRSLQHAVISASSRVVGVYCATQRPTPEGSRLLW
jgi:hypothetical protein